MNEQVVLVTRAGNGSSGHSAHWVTILNKSRGDVGRRTLTHNPLLFQDKRYCNDLSFVFVVHCKNAL